MLKLGLSKQDDDYVGQQEAKKGKLILTFHVYVSQGNQLLNHIPVN